MIKITGKFNMHQLKDHAERYTGSGNTIDVYPRVTPIRGEWNEDGIRTEYDLTLWLADECLALNRLTEDEAINTILAVCAMGALEVSRGFYLWINQAYRQCWPVKITPTRVRLEYQLPKSGWVGGWYPTVTIGGKKFIKFDHKYVR